MSAEHWKDRVDDFKASYDPSRKLRVLNSVSEVSASDGERLDSEFRRLCKLQANDYQHVSDGSLHLIDSVNHALAHKSTDSQQFNNISKNDGELFAGIVMCSQQISKISCIARVQEHFDIFCAMVSSQLRLFCVMLLFCVLYAKITLIFYRILVSDPLDFKLTVTFDK